jgi:dienelactone hydrolase
VLLIADGPELPDVSRLEASLLASHGFPTLVVAYYGGPGLPANLERIELEYFILPLRFLRSRPEVDRSRLVAFGTYRGSEAALLLGARYTDLVRGVIALAPSAVVNPAYDTTSQFNIAAPAWTIGGEPLPRIHGFVGDPTPAGADRRAIIPVERIQGPVLTASARRDSDWTEWANATAIQTRLAAARFRYPHANADYLRAEYAVRAPVPGIALGEGRDALVDPGDDARARRDLWRRILRFLAQLPANA